MTDTPQKINQYKKRISTFEGLLKKTKGQIFWFAVLRMVVFLGFTTIAWVYFNYGKPAYLLIVGLATIILFFYTVTRHTNIKYRQSIISNLLKINENEIDILSQKPSFLPDGSSFHTAYTYSEDLDIFGPRSLYHMIQRCFSNPGREMVARWLMGPEHNKDLIIERQAMVKSVIPHIKLRQEFLAHGLTQFTKDQIGPYPEKDLIEASMFRKIRILRWIPPLIMFLAIVTAVLSHNNNVIFYGFLINLILTGFFLKVILKVMHRSDQTLKNLISYLQPLKILIQTDYSHPHLQKKKGELQNICRQLNVFKNRYNLLENRSNMLVGLLLNGSIGYDFIVLSQLQSWYRNNVKKIPGWLEEIAWYEALFSLANFAFNHPSYSFPDLDLRTGISGVNIRHPFIPDEENIGNQLHLAPPLKIILLTGSNMSGKSTFLRSLGVNQVLAMAGSVVAADEFHTGIYRIFTSFRKSDSIQEHTSLFYDELKKLRYIFNELENHKGPSLILLDEILRGTNSDDKYYGSKQVLLRLKEQNTMALLATHDIALAELEVKHGPIIQNYSFESQIDDGELYFDYKLRKGVAVNKNATFLMAKMGIIPRTI